MIHIRQPYVPASQQMAELPRDIVWLQRGTFALAGLLVVIFALVALRAFLLAPWFSIQSMRILGQSSYDVQFHNALTIRANVLPQLTGNYFSLNLRQTQKAFESLPWIRSAVVQREFPNQIKVALTAHTPIARWTSLDASSSAETKSDVDIEQLLNVQGEVFETSGGPIDTDSLPALSGPVRKASEVLALFQSLQINLQTHAKDVNWQVVQLSLNPLGMWRAVLNNQAVLELGSGTKEEIMTRTTRWLLASAQVKNKYNAHDLQSVDLRYPNGFATRLAGITTK
jgi:cell division protein FtsQ